MDGAANEAALVTTAFDLGRVEVGEMHPSERDEAIAVIARAMSDSPQHIAAFGTDLERNCRHLKRMFRSMFTVVRGQRPLVARLDGRIVGATNELREAGCRPTAIEKLRLAPAVLAVGPRALPRVGRWLADWERRDPDAAHSHYGPFGVEPALQGRGIGSLVLGEYTRRLDADGLDAYLETDKPENVALYSRFGFEVIDEGGVLDAPNWFMWRQAGADAPATLKR
jgi:GNAT superfamily N-acetyltransferase